MNQIIKITSSRAFNGNTKLKKYKGGIKMIVINTFAVNIVFKSLVEASILSILIKMKFNLLEENL